MSQRKSSPGRRPRCAAWSGVLLCALVFVASPRGARAVCLRPPCSPTPNPPVLLGTSELDAQLITILYAPPGNASSVSYSTLSGTGNSTVSTNTFAFSANASVGFSVPLGGTDCGASGTDACGGTLSGSLSGGYAFTDVAGQSELIQYEGDQKLTIGGKRDDVQLEAHTGPLGVELVPLVVPDPSSDVFDIWLNPAMQLFEDANDYAAKAPASAAHVFYAMSYDPFRDPTHDPGAFVLPIQEIELTDSGWSAKLIALRKDAHLRNYDAANLLKILDPAQGCGGPPGDDSLFIPCHSPCLADTDCGEDQVCSVVNHPGGTCVFMQRRWLRDRATFLALDPLSADPSFNPTCALPTSQSCSTAADCAAGDACVSGVCYDHRFTADTTVSCMDTKDAKDPADMPCSTDMDCPNGMSCNTGFGLCYGCPPSAVNEVAYESLPTDVFATTAGFSKRATSGAISGGSFSYTQGSSISWVSPEKEFSASLASTEASTTSLQKTDYNTIGAGASITIGTSTPRYLLPALGSCTATQWTGAESYPACGGPSSGLTCLQMTGEDFACEQLCMSDGDCPKGELCNDDFQSLEPSPTLDGSNVSVSICEQLNPDRVPYTQLAVFLDTYLNSYLAVNADVLSQPCPPPLLDGGPAPVPPIAVPFSSHRLRIAGTVFYNDGVTPASSLQVVLRAPLRGVAGGLSGGAGSADALLFSATDAQGSFEFQDLLPGDYLLGAGGVAIQPIRLDAGKGSTALNGALAILLPEPPPAVCGSGGFSTQDQQGLGCFQ